MKFGFLLIFACLLSGCVQQLSFSTEKKGTKHYVFAHYMVCFATYKQHVAGKYNLEAVEGYKREIREAQAAGIDGFALNVGAWSREEHYKHRTRMIYQAAEELGTGFKLFFSVDMGDVPDIIDMIKTYGHHPNQFIYDNRIVVSTFAHSKVPWKEEVIKPLKSMGYDVFFVPYFYPRPKVTELPDYDVVAEHYSKHADLVDGMFYFGAAGLPEQLAESNRAYARVMKETGKVCMVSYTPHYWGFRQYPGRRYYEFRGGEGTELQWRSIIDSDPDWVEIVTWNDFNESSYVSPVDDPGKYFRELQKPRRGCHAGYLELSRYYIEWYKSGKQPSIDREGIFYFYRPHPKGLIADNDDKPVKSLHGDVDDCIYVTTMMKKPCELVVVSGGRESRHEVQPGINHLRIPFAPGQQNFKVYRKGKCIIASEGEPVADKIDCCNFYPVSGFAYVKKRQ